MLQSTLTCDLDCSVKIVRRRGLKAIRCTITSLTEEVRPAPALDYLSTLERCSAALPKRAQHFIARVAALLLDAEAEAHKQSIETLTLYEVASPHAVAQLVCIAWLLERLGILEAYLSASPVAVGGGHVEVKFHGLLPVPTPATLAILRSRNIPSMRGPVDAELTTPTGAALLAALEPRFAVQPPQDVQKVGRGAGDEVDGLPNILTIFVSGPRPLASPAP